MHVRTNWLSDTIGGGREKSEEGTLKRVRASSFSSPCSFLVHVTNSRQLKLGLPRAFKRRHFRSHVRNESSGTRIDASAAQKDIGDDAGRVAPLREASSEARFKAV